MNPVLILIGLWWAFALGASLVWLARTAWRLGHPYRETYHVRFTHHETVKRHWTVRDEEAPLPDWVWDVMSNPTGASLRVISDREHIDRLVGPRTYEGNDA